MSEDLSPDSGNEVSWWEDLLEIFIAPAKVFSRRANRSFGIPFLVFVVLVGVMSFGLMGPVEPALEADAVRQIEAAADLNPDLPRDRMLETVPQRIKFAPILFVVALAISVPLVGLLIWLVGKGFGSAATVGQAMLIAAFAAFPKILGILASGVQALVMDPAALTSMSRLSLGPARVLDPDTTSAGMVQLAMRFDLTILWATVLIAIGVKVMGKVEGSKAWGTALSVWLIGFIPALLTYLRS